MPSTVSETPRAAATRDVTRPSTAPRRRPARRLHRPRAPHRPRRRRGAWRPSSTACRPRRAGFASSGGASPPRRAARALVEPRHRPGRRPPAPRSTVVAHACFVPETTAIAPSSPSRSPTPGRVAASPPCCSPTSRSSPQARGIVTFVGVGASRPTAGCFRCSATRASPSRCVPSRACWRSSCRRQLGPEASDRFEERDRIAAVAAVRHVLRPASIARDRRVAPAGERRRRRSSAISWPARSPGRSTRSTRTPKTIAGRRPTPPSPTSPDRSTWPSSPSPRRRARGRAGMRRKGVRALVVLSAGFGEDGAGGRGAAGGAAGHLPASGHAARRAQLPRRAQHRPRGRA